MSQRRTKRSARAAVPVEYGDPAGAAPVDAGDAKPLGSPAKKRRAKPAVKPHSPPNDWQTQYALIERMRADKTAAVDSMGTEAFLDPDAPPEVARFFVLVAAMLSSQTKDEVTAAAMRRLREHGLSVANVLATDQAKLASLLRPVGFFNNKAKFLRATCEVLQRDHGGDIPRTVEGLVALPGIGPKMAYLVMNVAWKDSAGICVDTHVHRICNRLGWVKTWNKKGASQNPELTRLALEDWLPRDLWSEINPLLVGFGQQVCLPQRPKCHECLLRDACPAAKRGGAV